MLDNPLSYKREKSSVKCLVGHLSHLYFFVFWIEVVLLGSKDTEKRLGVLFSGAQLFSGVAMTMVTIVRQSRSNVEAERQGEVVSVVLRKDRQKIGSSSFTTSARRSIDGEEETTREHVCREMLRRQHGES